MEILGLEVGHDEAGGEDVASPGGLTGGEGVNLAAVSLVLLPGEGPVSS